MQNGPGPNQVQTIQNQFQELAQQEQSLREREERTLQSVAHAQQRMASIEQQRQKFLASLDGDAEAAQQAWYEQLKSSIKPIDFSEQFQTMIAHRQQAIEACQKAEQALTQGLGQYAEYLEQSEQKVSQLKRQIQEYKADQIARSEADVETKEVSTDLQAQAQLEAAKAEEEARAAQERAERERKAQERRTHTRIELSTAITLESDSNFYTGLSGDISEGGLFVSTVNVLPPGTPINLSFSLPDGSEHHAQGLVRWTREWNDMTPDIMPGMGVEFEGIADNSRTTIAHFVAQRESLYFDEDLSESAA